MRFWSLRLPVGAGLIVNVARREELRITRANFSTAGAGAAVVVLRPCVGPGRGEQNVPPSESASSRFRVGSAGGAGLSARLCGSVSGTWELEARYAQSAVTPVADATVELLGYYYRRHAAEPSRPHRSGFAASAASGRRDHLDPPPLPPAAHLVRLPSGWAGLSFKAVEGEPVRLVVTDVPKACFSSAAFGAAAAAQVSGVSPGDSILAINGQSHSELAARIARPGDLLNTCSVAVPVHTVGSIGKLASPPCISCDFVRRHRELGIDVALQMWMRAVKRDTPITLTVLPQVPALAPLLASPKSASPAAPVAAPPMESKTPQPVVVPASDAVRPQARYNPLRPAAATAAAAAAAAGTAPGAKAAAQPRPAATGKAGGFAYEDRTLGAGPVAKVGQEVEIRFSLRIAKKETKVLERGEIWCCLGKAEVLDGWVDGHVDLEEVLASWGNALAGMRVGGSRRVHVPPRLGFRSGGGGDSVPSGSEVVFDVDLKKLR